MAGDKMLIFFRPIISWPGFQGFGSDDSETRHLEAARGQQRQSSHSRSSADTNAVERSTIPSSDTLSREDDPPLEAARGQQRQSSHSRSSADRSAVERSTIPSSDTLSREDDPPPEATRGHSYSHGRSSADTTMEHSTIPLYRDYDALSREELVKALVEEKFKVNLLKEKLASSRRQQRMWKSHFSAIAQRDTYSSLDKAGSDERAPSIGSKSSSSGDTFEQSEAPAPLNASKQHAGLQQLAALAHVCPRVVLPNINEIQTPPEEEEPDYKALTIMETRLSSGDEHNRETFGDEHVDETAAPSQSLLALEHPSTWPAAFKKVEDLLYHDPERAQKLCVVISGVHYWRFTNETEVQIRIEHDLEISMPAVPFSLLRTSSKMVNGVPVISKATVGCNHELDAAKVLQHFAEKACMWRITWPTMIENVEDLMKSYPELAKKLCVCLPKLQGQRWTNETEVNDSIKHDLQISLPALPMCSPSCNKRNGVFIIFATVGCNNEADAAKVLQHFNEHMCMCDGKARMWNIRWPSAIKNVQELVESHPEWAKKLCVSIQRVRPLVQIKDNVERALRISLPVEPLSADAESHDIVGCHTEADAAKVLQFFPDTATLLEC